MTMKTSGKKNLFHLYTLLLFMGFSHGRNLFNNDRNPQLPDSYKIGWMEAIENDKLLSDITIPGTHDTMALYGGRFVKCQAWDLSDQLRAGIRYLDLRILKLGNNLYAMHGPFYQNTNFGAILGTIRAFLLQFPSEVVLVRVKPTGNVTRLVGPMVSNNGNFWVKSEMPTLGMARGKIVFVQKSKFTLGVPHMGTDTGGDYIVTNIADKGNKIEDHLAQATEETGGKKLVLSYSSGTGFPKLRLFLTPQRVAEEINPRLERYLNTFYNNHPRSCLGIIAMDFPGTDLIQTVIKFNTW